MTFKNVLRIDLLIKRLVLKVARHIGDKVNAIEFLSAQERHLIQSDMGQAPKAW